MMMAEAGFQKDLYFQKYHIRFECINEFQAIIHGKFKRQ